MLKIIFTIFLIGLLVFGCVTENSQSDSNQSLGVMNLSNKTTTSIANSSKITVVLETSDGNITLELNKEKAPVTVANFISYVNSGFYNGTVFHRVIPGFMVQGGGFTSDGTQKPTQTPIMLESNNSLSNLVGTIAMARTSDPNSATSQFFINTVDNSFLDFSQNPPGYAVFGKVISGIDVVHEIENSPTETREGMANWPVQEVLITGAYIKTNS